MKIEKILKDIFQEIISESKTNEAFRARLAQCLHCIERDAESNNVLNPTRTHRRKKGPFDPMLVYIDQPQTLKDRLYALSIPELKNIVAEHGMDRTRLALKWKSKERLVDLITTTVHNRSQKGDAFRTITIDPKSNTKTLQGENGIDNL